IPANTGILYVDGDATFNSVDFSAASSSLTVIVSGNLTLGPNTTTVPGAVRVPPTAALEYPYATTTSNPMPCQSSIGATCNPTFVPGGVQMKGFLFVAGDLIVSNSWTIDGAVMVGDLSASPPRGALKIAAGALFTVLYDDTYNRNIVVNPIYTTGTIDLQMDVLRDV